MIITLSLTAIKKSDLLTELHLQARDIRFSALTTLLVRRARIILRLQVIYYHCVSMLGCSHQILLRFILYATADFIASI